MIPRRELTELLETRLGPLMPNEQLVHLVEEILNLENDWEEVEVSHRDMGYSVSETCSDMCWLAEQIDRGAVLRMYRKKKHS